MYFFWCKVFQNNVCFALFNWMQTSWNYSMHVQSFLLFAVLCLKKGLVVDNKFSILSRCLHLSNPVTRLPVFKINKNPCFTGHNNREHPAPPPPQVVGLQAQGECPCLSSPAGGGMLGHDLPGWRLPGPEESTLLEHLSQNNPTPQKVCARVLPSPWWWSDLATI